MSDLQTASFCVCVCGWARACVSCQPKDEESVQIIRTPLSLYYELFELQISPVSIRARSRSPPPASKVGYLSGGGAEQFVAVAEMRHEG